MSSWLYGSSDRRDRHEQAKRELAGGFGCDRHQQLPSRAREAASAPPKAVDGAPRRFHRAIVRAACATPTGDQSPSATPAVRMAPTVKPAPTRR